MLEQLDTWHKTKRGYITFAAVEFALAYIVGSFAINNGSLLFYGATIILLYGTVRNLALAVQEHKQPKHARSRTKKTA